MPDSNLPKVTYRDAKVSDRDAVLRIDENFLGGADYLSACYTHWVHAPRYFPCVALVGDKVVGYTVRYVQPDNVNVSIMSTRVNAAYQGHGIMKGMGDYVRSKAKEKYPNIQYVCWGAILNKFNEETQIPRLRNSPGFSIGYMEWVMFDITRQALIKVSAAINNCQSARMLSMLEFVRHIQEWDNMSSIIDPDTTGVFMHGFGPQNLVTAPVNVKETFYLSQVSGVMHPQTGRLASLGYGNTMRCGAHDRLEIIIHSTTLGDYLSHVLVQLRHFLSITGAGALPTTAIFIWRSIEALAGIRSELCRLFREGKMINTDEKGINIRVAARKD